MGYDDFGNITSRDSTGTLGDVGNYAYATNTNRVSSAGGRNFFYNDNGSITSVTGTSSGNITWAAFNKPYTLESNNKRSAFSYDTGNNRVTQTRETDIGSSQWLTNSRKTYVGSLFEQEQAWEPATGSASPADQLDRTKWDITSTRIYISTPAGVVGSWISEVGQANPKKTLFHRDHLGSVIAETDLADPYGNISKEFSYDTWGLARDATDWDEAPAVAPERTATDRGFTGHEMLDELGLIHMNGRIYDPLLGRMLSADPHIQSPTNLQNYNRYSYVTNNPLSMTDPSGFFFKKLFKKIGKFLGGAFKTIVTIALAAIPVLGYYLAAVWVAYNAYEVGGFSAALIAVAAVVVTWGIGEFFDSFYNAGDALRSGVELARATIHGVAQGGFAELQGGDFGDGFLAGFSGSLAGSMITAKSGEDSYFGEATDKGKYLVRRTVAASVVGGTAAELGGGKFANGAATAAMVHLFNHEGSHGTAAERKTMLDRIRRLHDRQQGILSDMNELEGAIVFGEAFSTGHQVLHEGIQLGVTAAKGFSLIKGMFGFRAGAYTAGNPSVAGIDQQIGNAQLQRVGSGVATEALSVGAGAGVIKSISALSESFSDAFSSGRGSMSQAYNTSVQLERSYHQVTHQLNQLRAEYRERF